MNEKYLLRLQEDLRLKNFTQNTCRDYYRFTKRFLEFTGKDAMSITYADIRKFIFHMKDNESKKASTINVYTAAIRFFFEYTLGYVWDPQKDTQNETRQAAPCHPYTGTGESAD